MYIPAAAPNASNARNPSEIYLPVSSKWRLGTAISIEMAAIVRLFSTEKAAILMEIRSMLTDIGVQPVANHQGTGCRQLHLGLQKHRPKCISFNANFII